jgi:DNA-binding MarR family transcriptional regulator
MLRELHGALIDIVSVMNRPQRDEAMVREAGIALDRALFPLLVMVERLGPIGIGELADRVGRDYTTVSRQITKLESLRFVARQSSATDGRVREVVATAGGRALTDRIDIARERVAQAIFADWTEQDVADLTRLMRRFADSVQNEPAARA